MQISLCDVTKSYRQGENQIVAVNNVNLEVTAGDFSIITGRSGSGKTTLLSLIGGLTHASTGTICIDDVNLLSLDDKTLSLLRAEKIGFIFQFASLLPTLTVLENVRLPRLFAHMSNENNGTRIHADDADKKKNLRSPALVCVPYSGKQPGLQYACELLQMVGLEDKSKTYPAQLSGGQRRRVAIARALVNRPAILLADEPTGDLDVDTEAEILELFHSLNRQGTTILLVTHNPNLASIGNRLFQMERGRLIEFRPEGQTQCGVGRVLASSFS
jgi:ABC-type lipoprotein export system ATPase subunit